MSSVRKWMVCAAAALVVFLSSCASPHKDIQVKTNANPKVNFAGYDSYAWAAAAAVIRDPDRDWVPPDFDIGAQITFLVDRELRDRGMSEVVTAPDVLVIYAIGIDMKNLDVVTDPEDDTKRFEEVPQGGLKILLADPATRQVMWVGSATADLMEEPNEELAKERLDYAITEMFKKFPK